MLLSPGFSNKKQYVYDRQLKAYFDPVTQEYFQIQPN
jgi:hypothetical protein